MEDLTGKQLGQYRIVAPLGKGGMASVYKVYQPSVERYVALKILPRHYASDPDFVQRFKQEAKIIASLEHPHILPVHDYSEADGYTYLVMRYIEGKTLTHLLQENHLPLPKICKIISEIASALDYAHARGIVHRDIKPSNVLIDGQGNCLLSDFGIAKILTSSPKITTTGAFIGTPTYASPEQCLGNSNLDGRSDIYSLGVILYEMTTGRPPFHAETPMGLVHKHIYDPLPLPRQVNPALPETIERVILKALAKEPTERYRTAGALAHALNAAAVEVDDGTILDLPKQTFPGTTVVAPIPQKTSKIPIWGWALVCLLSLCILVSALGLSIKVATSLDSHTKIAASTTPVASSTIMSQSAKTPVVIVASPVERVEKVIIVTATEVEPDNYPTMTKELPTLTSHATDTIFKQPTPTPSNQYAQISEEVLEVNLRNSPGYLSKDDSLDVIVKIPQGATVEVIDGPKNVDGLTWWKVAWNGYEGWIADHTSKGRIIMIFNP